MRRSLGFLPLLPLPLLASLGLMGLMIGLSGCADRAKVEKGPRTSVQRPDLKPSPIYASVAQVFEREGCTLAVWRPDAPHTLTVSFPPAKNPRDLDRGTAQRVATAARQKIGPQGRVYIYSPDRSLLAYATPEHPDGR